MKKESVSLILFILILFSGPVEADVIINEVMPHSNNSLQDEWIELYNNGSGNLTLLNWIISDGTGNDSINLTINSGSYAIIVDTGINYSNYFGCIGFYNYSNNSNISCFEVGTIGTSGLLDTGENVILYNLSSIVSNFTWNFSLNHYGKSFGYNGSAWVNCTPTPGSINNCSMVVNITCTATTTCTSYGSCSNSKKTRTCVNTSAQCVNTTYTQETSRTSSSDDEDEDDENEIDLDISWTSKEIINNREFKINLQADNLEDMKYDVKVWLESKNNSDLKNEIYDENEEKWKASNYFIEELLEGDGDDSGYVNLRLKEGYTSFTGEVYIFFRLREHDSGDTVDTINDTIKILKEETNTISTLNQLTNTQPNITETSSLTKSKQTEDIKTPENSLYMSRTELIKKYAPYAFSGLCIVLLALVLIDANRRKK